MPCCQLCDANLAARAVRIHRHTGYTAPDRVAMRRPSSRPPEALPSLQVAPGDIPTFSGPSCDWLYLHRNRAVLPVKEKGGCRDAHRPPRSGQACPRGIKVEERVKVPSEQSHFHLTSPHPLLTWLSRCRWGGTGLLLGLSECSMKRPRSRETGGDAHGPHPWRDCPVASAAAFARFTTTAPLQQSRRLRRLHVSMTCTRASEAG